MYMEIKEREYKCYKCYYFEEYFEDGNLLVENECKKLDLNCFKVKKNCRFFEPNIEEYRKIRINEIKCKKCGNNDFKFEIRIENKSIKLICSCCNKKIKKFINQNKVYSFLLFMSTLKNETEKEVKILNFRKDFKKVESYYDWIKYFDFSK